MSEFKVGDKVVFKSSSLSACVKDVKEVLRCAGDYYLVWKKDGFHVNLLRHATLAEIRIGHRIDNPCKCCNGHGEVGNMLESFVCPKCNGDRVERNDLGDDFPIENRISPNCKSRDV